MPSKKNEILNQTKKKLVELNFNFAQGRIDQSHHPFCGGANSDVRITTRFENNILETLSALFHETGHGVYEQNRPKELLYEPVGQSRSLSVHESQSLFYENHIFIWRGSWSPGHELLLFLYAWLHCMLSPRCPSGSSSYRLR